MVRTRNWALIVVLIFVICSSIFYFFFISERNRIIENITSNQKIHAKQAARTFTAYIEKWNQMLYSISMDKAIIDLNDDGKKQIENIFKIVKDEITNITITNKVGEISYTIPYNNSVIGRDISNQKHMIKILLTHKPVISDVFYAVQGYNAIAIHYPIFKNKKYNGSIAFLINFEHISKEILDEILVDKTFHAWLVSSDGIELFCANNNHIGKSAFENANPTNQKSFLKNYMLKGGEGSTIIKLDSKANKNQSSIVYYLPIKTNNTFWSLAVSSFKHVIDKPLWDYSIKLLVIFITLFASGVLFFRYFFRVKAVLKESEALKKVEQELKESKERYQLFSKLTSDYVFINSLDENGNVTYDWIDGAFTSMTGFTIEEYMQNGGWNSILFEKDNAIDAQDIEQLRKNIPVVTDVRTVTKSNAIIWVRVYAHPIWDEENNKLKGIYGAVKNINQNKQAEIALRESESRFRSIYNSVREAIFIHDLTTGQLLQVNSFAEKIFNASKEEIFAGKLSLFSAGFPPYTANEGREWMEKTIKEGPQTFEWLARKKNGELFWLEVQMSLVNIGDVERLLVAARDITERKNFEEQLLTLSTALDQSPASIVITNPNGIIEYVNSSFCQTTGYNSKELLGVQLRLLNDAKDMSVNREEIWRNLRDGKEWRSEHLNKRKDASAYWESTIISPVKNSNGEIIHFLAVQEDISERKKFELHLIESKQKAEEINRLKSNFLSNMSHELRTPLVGTLGLSELLYDELEGEQKEFAGMINKSSNRLLETLNTLLNYSNLDSGSFEVKLTHVSVIELLQTIVEKFKNTIESTELFIKEEYNSNNFLAAIDPEIYSIVISNLLSNAIRFTHQGGITFTLDRTKDEIIVSIKDTGIGIPEDKLNVIFDDFRQVSEGKGRNFDGTGLGLTIVKKYVEALGGKVSVTSKFGSGSVFVVSVPALEIKLSNQVETVKEIENEIGLSEAQKLKVLLVEDDGINIYAFNKMLSDYCVVTEATNGEEAINLASSNVFDIILMDINLKIGLSGVDAMERIRLIDRYKNTPIVAITAFAEYKDKLDFLNIGFTNYLAKPFTKEQLQELISSIKKEYKL